MLCVLGGEHVCPVGGVMCVFVWWERSNVWTEKPKFYLFWRGRRCLVGIVVSRLVLQLVVRQQLQGGSLHLQLTAAWAAGGEADGASTSAGGDGVDRIFFFFLSECQTVISTWGGFSECELHGSGLRWLQWHHPAPAAVSCGRRWTVWPPPPPPPADASAASYESLTFPP